MANREELREQILDEVTQAYNEFIFFQRKIDKFLPLNSIEDAILDGVVSVEEIGEEFKRSLIRAVNQRRENKKL